MATRQVPTDVPVHRGSVGAMSVAAGCEPVPLRFYRYRGYDFGTYEPKYNPEPEPEPEPKPKPKRKRAKPKPPARLTPNRVRPDGGLYPDRVYAPATYHLFYPRPRASADWTPPTLSDFEELLDD